MFLEEQNSSSSFAVILPKGQHMLENIPCHTCNNLWDFSTLQTLPNSYQH